MKQEHFLYEDLAEFLNQSDQLIESEHLGCLIRGIVLAKLDRYEEAIESYRQALKVEPTNPKILYYQGIALIAVGQRQEAISSFDKILKIKPDYYRAWRAQAFLLFALEHLEQAINAWNKALEIEPDDAQSWYKRGIALSRLKHFEDAINSYTKALEFQPDYKQAKSNRDLLLRKLKILKFQSEDHTTWFNRGMEAYNVEDYGNALEFWHISLKIKNDYCEAWYYQGRALDKLRDYQKAIFSYEQALNLNPNYQEAWDWKGVSLRKLNNYEEAIASFDKSLSIKPDSYETLNERGFSLSRLGRYEEAISSYDQAININPDFYGAWINRGIAQYKLKRYEEAVASYDRALTINPNGKIAKRNRNSALYQLEQTEKLSNIDEEKLAIYAEYIKQILSCADDEEIKDILINNHHLIDTNFLLILKQSIKIHSERGNEEAVQRLSQLRPLMGKALAEVALEQSNTINANPNQNDLDHGNSKDDLNDNPYPKIIEENRKRQKKKERSIKFVLLLLLFIGGILTFTLGKKFLLFLGIAFLALIGLGIIQSILSLNRGRSLYNQGKYQEALNFYDAHLMLLPRSLEAWYQRGRVLRMLGRYEEAVASYDRVIKLEPKHYSAWNNRGIVLNEMWRFEESIESYDRSLAIKPDDQESWYNRGNSLAALERYEEAIASFDQSLSIKSNVLTWTVRGQIYLSLKNYEEAIRSFENALSLEPTLENLLSVQELLNPRPAIVGEALPESIFEQNLIEQSRYERARAMRDLAQGKLFETQGNIDLAIVYYYKSNLHLEVSWSLEVRENMRDQLLKSAIVTIFFSLVNALIEADRLEEALAIAEKAKGRKLREQFADFTKNPFRPVSFPDNFAPLAKGLNSWGDFLTSLYNMPFENELNIQTDIAFSEIPNLLPDDETVLIEWFVTTQAIHAFVMTKKQFYTSRFVAVFSINQNSTNELFDWFNNYDKSYRNLRGNIINGVDLTLQENRWDKNLSFQLQQLSRLLRINDIIDHINHVVPNCNSVILIPHLFLHLLPLHALPIGEEEKVLLDLFPAGIRYFPSCGLLKSLQERNARWDSFFNLGRCDLSDKLPLKSLLAFSNPTTNLSIFPELHYSDIEVETIKKFFPYSFVFSKEEATKNKLHFPISSLNCIHFSCHGFFNYKNPQESSLILAHGQRITLEDLTGSNSRSMNDCYLVALPACESGLTDTTNFSDEYIGLPSGFLIAGAKAVVSSLWLVDDLSTALLMIKFYENLTNQQSTRSLSVSIALNQSQQWLRKATTADLLAWIKTLPLEPEEKLFWRRSLRQNYRLDSLPFANVYYWGGFCAIS